MATTLGPQPAVVMISQALLSENAVRDLSALNFLAARAAVRRVASVSQMACVTAHRTMTHAEQAAVTRCLLHTLLDGNILAIHPDCTNKKTLLI